MGFGGLWVYRVLGLGFRGLGFGFRVWGLRFGSRVWGMGVSGFIGFGV